MTTTLETPIKTRDAHELMRRSGGGMRVRLLWFPSTNDLLVEQLDIGSGTIIYRETSHEENLEVFHHPTVYPEAKLDFAPNVTAGAIEEVSLY
jgi:hypothetical protein